MRPPAATIRAMRTLPLVPFLAALAGAALAMAACEPPASGVAVDAYDCMEDPALDDRPTIPQADTAGLAATIAAHFPEWRLSTEREIACRFPLRDGGRPAEYWPEWGSGRAWWTWTGDFNGDGLPDRLVLLTFRTDPARDLLAVLHGSGTAAPIAEPGGWGIEVLPAGSRIDSGWEVHPVELATDGIHLLFWERASELFYWEDGGYISVTTSD
jgi:hypothetical protein